MRIIKYFFVLALSMMLSTVSAQSFQKDWLEQHPKEAVDSIGMVVRYHRYYQEEQSYYAEVIDTMLNQIVSSPLDSIWKSLAFKESYKVVSKRDVKSYFKRIRAIASYAPKDSVQLKLFSKYMIGNAFIFSERYDSAAYYLNQAYDYDESYDLGKYSGAVAERLSMIFYRLGDYNRSLEFALLALEDAEANLRGAVFNQMANTYTLTAQYEEAAVAYDSAAYYFELVNNQRWWTPIYNSMTTHLELGDSARFIAAYNKIKDVPFLKQSARLDHMLDMSKAEFSLTEWQRTPNLEAADFGGIVLAKTTENEQWIRDVIQEQVSSTTGQWREHRDALYLLKRWYDLCAPDSVFFAYHRILALDKEYELSKGFTNRSPFLESGDFEELQSLTSRLSYRMLEKRLNEVSETKRLLIRHSQNSFMYLLLLLVGIFALRKTLNLRKEKLRILEHLNALKIQEEALLRKLLPEIQFEAWKKGGQIVPETFEEVIILSGNLKGVTAAMDRTNPDDLLLLLDNCFTQFKDICNQHDLSFIRADGTSFTMLGGVKGPSVRPLHALAAAQQLLARTQQISDNSSSKHLSFDLSIAIHLGQIDAGVPKNRAVGYDFWGDDLEECKALEGHCKPGQIMMSKGTAESELPGQQWPAYKTVQLHGREVLVFGE